MLLKSQVESMGPSIPKELESKLFVRATYALTEQEAKLFSLAIQAIVQQLKCEGKSFEDIPRVNAIVTKYGNVEIESDEGVLGNHVSLVIYAVQKWRDLKLSDYQMLIVYIEELCHNYWGIEDEIVVKYKVFEIIKRIEPNLKFEELFDLKSL